MSPSAALLYAASCDVWKKKSSYLSVIEKKDK